MTRMYAAGRMIAAGAALGAAVVGATGIAAASRPAATVRLAWEAPAGLSHATALGALDPARRLVVAVTVKKDLAALRQAEAALYDPASPSYHRFLTPAQFRARYDAPAAVVTAIRAYVTRDGLKLYNAQTLGDYVMASGSAAQVERTFGTQLERFRAAGSGRTFFANLRAPRVPANLGIDAVLGLDSRPAYHTADLASSAARGTASGPAAADCLPDPQSASGNVCTGLMSPTDLWGAYHMPADDRGQGQTIGIIGEGQSADVIAALREFEKTRGLPTVPVQVYHTDPGDSGTPELKRDDSGRIEWELDTQASTGMAPDVSQVRLYFGSSLQLTQLTGAIATWANDPQGPLQVDASLGACENDPAINTLYGADQRADMALLTQTAMEGRTLFAASGDIGSTCSAVVSENGIQYGPVPTDEYPAIDPNAVSVGGTVLYTDGAGHRVVERAWDHTGGGPSHWIVQPAYQTGASPLLEANACATDSDGTAYAPGQLCRGGNDVSALSGDITISAAHRFGDLGVSGPASGNGYDMVDDCPSTTATAATDAVTPPCAYGAAPGTMVDHFAEGGTSLSSPLWAGMWARVQAHHDAVDPTTLQPTPSQSLGLADPVIYRLAQGSATARDFNDITLGANPLPAGPGWDFPTGWGSPDLTNLIEDASGNATTAPVSSGGPSGPDPSPLYATPPAAPNCAYLFFNASPQAPDPYTGTQDSQLAMVEGDMGLTADKQSLRVVLTIQDLNKSTPTGTNFNDYTVFWNYTAPGASTPTAYAVDVHVSSSGAVSYTDGTESETTAGGQTTYSFTPNATSHATGTFGSGTDGKIEIDVPLSDIGNPAAGAVLSGATAQSASGADATVTSFGFISQTAGPGNSYRLGQPTCIDAGS